MERLQMGSGMLCTRALVFLHLLYFVRSFSLGPPDGACITRTPNHATAEAQTTDCPYRIEAHNWIPGVGTDMILQEEGNGTFKGFLLSVQHPNGMLLGSMTSELVSPSDAKVGEACMGTSMSHKDPKPKNYVVLKWKAPDDLDVNVKVIIRLTVVKEFTTFYVDCNPFYLEVDPSYLTTATSTTASTASTATSATSTTAAPPTTRPTTTTTTIPTTTTTTIPTTTTTARPTTTTTSRPTTTTTTTTKLTTTPTTTTTTRPTTTTTTTTKPTTTPTTTTPTTTTPTTTTTTTTTPTTTTTTTTTPTTTTTTTAKASVTKTSTRMTTTTPRPTTTVRSQPSTTLRAEVYPQFTSTIRSTTRRLTSTMKIITPRATTSREIIENAEDEDYFTKRANLKHDILSDTECMENGNFFRVLPDTQCRRYSQNAVHEVQCPTPLVFDPVQCSCNWPSQSPPCQI